MLSQRDSFLQAVKLEAAILILTKCKNGVEVWKRWIHMVGGFSGLKPLESQHTE